MKQLVAAHTREPAALLNLGWADYQAGRNADAVAAWRKTASEFPDSPYGVDAEDALHPNTIPGLPIIVTGLAPPTRSRRCRPRSSLRRSSGPPRRTTRGRRSSTAPRSGT